MTKLSELAGGSGVTTYTSVDDLPLTHSAGDMAFVDSSDRLYVSTGSGWYSVSLVNATPTISSVLDSDGNTGPFTLSTAGANTVITVTASDSDGTPITYSATADSDFDGLATFTQSSNVFTVTPFSEDSATTETGTITFKASDGIGLGTSQQTFQLNFTSVITNSNYTVALITTDGTTGDNETITDSSTNNHSITQSGNASASSFSPYRHGGYSAYFDGGNDYLQISSTSDFGFGTGDFTVECWVYYTGTDLSNDYIFDFRNSGDGSEARGALYPTGENGSWNYYVNGTLQIDGGTFNGNQWYHIALVRSSSTTTLYIDGTSVGSFSDSTNYADAGLVIGQRMGYSAQSWKGYMTDFRVVKGTAVYTSAFTPTTGRLTTIANTNLLTCHLPYIADASASGHSITVGGNVSTKPFSPYNNAEYSKADHGGSIYFDGSNDYITTTSSNFELSTSSAFSIEFWYYFVEDRTHTVFDFYDSTAAVAKLAFTSTNVYLYDGSTNILSLTRTQRVGQWEHFCWTRDASNNHVFYINGEQVGTSTASTTIDVDIIDLGRRAGTFNNTFMYGHISDFSLTKGSVTRSAAFTPPTSPLSSTGTTLHIKGTDSTIVDKAQGIWHMRPEGSAAGSTAQTKFASSSIYIPTAAKINCQQLVNFGAGDFTIETWARSPSANTGYNGIFALEDRLMNSTATTGGLQLAFRTGNLFDLYHSDGTSSSKSFTWSTDTWYHIALVRSGSTITLYVDGTSIGTETSSTDYSAFKFLTVGMYYNTSYALLSYIEDFRLTDGLARYTTTFTPPNASLQG